MSKAFWLQLILFVIPGTLFWGVACVMGMIFSDYLQGDNSLVFLGLTGILAIICGWFIFLYHHEKIKLFGVKFWFHFSMTFLGAACLGYFVFSGIYDAWPRVVFLGSNIFVQFFANLNLLFAVSLWFFCFTTYLLVIAFNKYRRKNKLNKN